MNHIFCIHSSVMGHVGCFQLLVITNKAAMNIVEHMPLWHGGAFWGYIPMCGIAGSSGISITNFLRDLQSFYSFQYHHLWKSVPLSPHPYHNVLLSEVLILAILNGVR